MLPLADHELCSVLVESHGMSEVANSIGRRPAEGERARDETNAGDRIPDTHEIDIDVCAESVLKLGAHLPPLGRVVLVELVGKVYLAAVASG